MRLNKATIASCPGPLRLPVGKEVSGFEHADVHQLRTMIIPSVGMAIYRISGALASRNLSSINPLTLFLLSGVRICGSPPL